MIFWEKYYFKQLKKDLSNTHSANKLLIKNIPHIHLFYDSNNRTMWGYGSSEVIRCLLVKKKVRKDKYLS